MSGVGSRAPLLRVLLGAVLMLGAVGACRKSPPGPEPLPTDLEPKASGGELLPRGALE